MTQKKLAKQYSFLNGKEAVVYVGRVPSEYKHVVKELSINKKENMYGEYQKISITIQKTHFNGKILTIFPKSSSSFGTILDFKVEQKDVDKLILIE